VFYGWWILAGLSLTQIVAWGVLYYTFGVLMTPMRAEFGWSAPVAAGAFSAGLLASALAAVPIGHYIDRHGARGVMTAGSCAAVLLLVAWSRVDSLAGLYAIWIGLGLTMSATLYEPAFSVIVRWFGQRRAAALSILTSVGGFASTVFVPLTVWLTTEGSWRSAVLTLAIVVAVTTIPVHAFVLRAPPDQRAAAIATGGATMSRDTSLDVTSVTVTSVAVMSASTPSPESPRVKRLDWWLAIAFAVSTLSASAAAVHVIPFLVASGHSLRFASFVLAVMGAAQVPGRLLFSPLTRIIPERALAPSVFVLQVAGLLSLSLSARSTTSAVLFAVLFGAGSGLTMLVRSLIVAEWFGIARYGAVSGRIALWGQFSRAAGPIVTAWVAAAISYRFVWSVLAMAAATSGIILFLLTRTIEDSIADATNTSSRI
jgi:MFS family permease